MTTASISLAGTGSGMSLSARRLPPLKHAAVDEDVRRSEGQQVFAAGNGSGGADKREFSLREFVSHESPALRRGGEFGIRRYG